MASRKKLKILIATAIPLVIAVCVVVGFKNRGYGIEVNDEGNGLRIYRHDEIASEFKEGYLVFFRKQTLRSPDLSTHEFYEYRLYDAPNQRGGFFEVWSDRDEPNQSHGKTTFTGPKIRLELQSRKIDVLKADVWYIKPH